jgi:hypothetical protein
MIRQILANNNEKCYSNFSPTFREANPPVRSNKLLLLARTWTSIDPDPAVKMKPTYRIGIRDSELAGWQGHHGEHAF